MDNKIYIVHYKGFDSSKYSKIKYISAGNRERIQKAKSLREIAGGNNYHEEQCNQIPEEINEDKHGIHLTPCYKKFT